MLDPIQHQYSLNFCGIGSHRKKWESNAKPCTLDEIGQSATLCLSQLLKMINSLGISISVAAIAVGQDP